MFNHSKFRHVFGTAVKRGQCYDDVRISNVSSDGRYVAVNPKFVAIVTESAGGGAFLVLPLSKTGRVETHTPQVTGHASAILDLMWCPFNDNLIASASEDSTVRVWHIPDEGIIGSNMKESVACLRYHQRKVTMVLWHPTAHMVLLSAGSDNLVIIWNLETAKPLVEIAFPHLIHTVAFNYNGSRIVTICKDKNMRVLDARTGEELHKGQAHAGRSQQAVYLKDGRIFTTGFGRMSERKYALWDGEDLSKPIVMEEVDKNNGVLSIYYDPDVNMIYLCGKGDRIVNFYEVTDKKPYITALNQYVSNHSAKGIGFMPKRGLDINKCEIARMYKLHSDSNLCEPIIMTVPRKSDLFQGDLYPDTASTAPALTSTEWFDQKIDRDPVLMSLKGNFDDSKVESTESQSRILSIIGGGAAKTNNLSTNNSPPVSHKPVVEQKPSRADDTRSAAAAPAPASPADSSDGEEEAVASSAEVSAMKEDIQKLKIIMKGHERRIHSLEEKLCDYEQRFVEYEQRLAEYEQREEETV
ncbi:coronin-1C-A-like [Tubulanus polymorphus]|uniref:coronin-1C-A-like n=1 Tax=Tubulanus polymorphus TaxID=672921 RepID=UPI003DA5DB1F